MGERNDVGAMAGQLVASLSEMMNGDEVVPGSVLWLMLHADNEATAAGVLLAHVRVRFGVDNATANAVCAEMQDLVELAGGTLLDIDGV